MNKKLKQELFRLLLCVAFPVLFETMYQAFVLKNGYGTIYTVLYAALFGGLNYIISGCLPVVAGKTFFCLLNGCLCLYFMVQAVYYRIFAVFFSFTSLVAVGADALEFTDTIGNAIAENIGILLLYVTVLAICSVAFCIKCTWERKIDLKLLRDCCVWLLVFFLFYGSLYYGEPGENGPYYLYTKEWNKNTGAGKLGMLVYAQKDFLDFIQKDDLEGELNALVLPERPLVVPELTKQPEVVAEEGKILRETALSPTEVPVDTSPNILPIDFAALAAAESNKEVKKLHEYFELEEYTRKNKYTGMFSGYNLIYITAEGFAPYAMREDLTPTLLKMATEGFVFNNFYTPLWMTSTIDGEFANCTGLLPDDFYSLRRMIGHDMRFCLGNMFGNLGYKTNAYHNHSYTYYDRDETHPSMGYTYKGRGNGLDVKKQWPGSDLEMMELSLPEYIGEEPFHVYYMTVSGHMDYSFNGNRMSYINRDVVENLPYSEEAKAYIACNYELEKALTYLVEQLNEAGIAERTVIALAADHYPYGLEKETVDELVGHEVEETFELYKSTLILWSPSMEQPVEVDKCCMSVDIVPTLANLFGLTYDSRLYMGKDILSDTEGLVIFRGKSFLTDDVMYDASTGEVIRLTDRELPENYIENLCQIVSNRFKVSKGIIDLDYYSYLPEASPN